MLSSIPLESFHASSFDSDLVRRAASLLTAEVTRLQRSNAKGAAANHGEIPRQVLGSPPAGASNPLDLERAVPTAAASSLTLAPSNVDELRRRASELLETLLGALAQGKGGTENSNDDRVPLIRAVAPVQAGSSALATIRVTNEEATASLVSFYSSNLVGDSGYEMPSLLVSISPRNASLAPGGAATFEIQVAVPAQAPAGWYSGLVQATGCKYVKAVITFQVL